MIRDIVLYPDQVLTTRTQEVPDASDPSILTLVNDLIDTCEHVRGLGVAAPQIGVSLRVCVVNADACGFPNLKNWGDKWLVMINPQIFETSADSSLSNEGCLSFPNISCKVYRAKTCKVEFLTLSNEVSLVEGSELLSAALQHELEHLDGQVFIRGEPPYKRSIIRQKMNVLKKTLKRKNATLSPVGTGFRF